MIPGDVALGVMEAMQYGMSAPLFTGSRAFGVEQEGSDWDFLVLGTPANVRRMPEEWVAGRSMGEEDDSSQFLSLRRGDLNLIVSLNETHYARFKLATELCTYLRGPAEKPKRIAVFAAIVLGRSPAEPIEF